jgi:hypothetical protein
MKRRPQTQYERRLANHVDEFVRQLEDSPGGLPEDPREFILQYNFQHSERFNLNLIQCFDGLFMDHYGDLVYEAYGEGDSVGRTYGKRVPNVDEIMEEFEMRVERFEQADALIQSFENIVSLYLTGERKPD